MRYSIGQRVQIFVKDYGFLSFVTNVNKSIDKKPENTVKSFWIILNNIPQMRLKLLQKSNSKNSGNNK